MIKTRTGEKLIQLSNKSIDPCTFCEKITNFLAESETPNKETPESSFNDIIELEKTGDDVIAVNQVNGTNSKFSSKIYPAKSEKNASVIFVEIYLLIFVWILLLLSNSLKE